uniref:Uncharacterized protein n=1 Tax=Octopus bimaculoides TaxID=37653 RepID=A0A0L8G967_OCTBM
MADPQVVEGPPAKRPKLASPALPSDSGDAFMTEFDLNEALPDELMSTNNSASDGSHNGTNDSQVPSGQDTSSQRHPHQQLSHLLQPTSVSTHSGNNISSPQNPQNQGGTGPPSRNQMIANINSSPSINNTVKSPLSGNLSSPPHLSKAGAASIHSTDLPLTSSSSSFSSSNNVISNLIIENVGNTHLGPPGVGMKPVTPQSASTQSTVSNSQSPHHSQLLNGPHYSPMTAAGPARNSTSNLAAGGLAISQNNVISTNTLSTHIPLSSHSVGHPALTAAGQTPMIKV